MLLKKKYEHHTLLFFLYYVNHFSASSGLHFLITSSCQAWSPETATPKEKQNEPKPQKATLGAKEVSFKRYFRELGRGIMGRGCDRQ